MDDESARAHARRHGAVLAVKRSTARAGEISLSPASVRSAVPPARLVLPSPNGSALALRLGDTGVTCLGVSLRNAAAVAAWITSRHGADGAAVAVVAAGEGWPGGGLRPAVEDLWGAGALVAHLVRSGWRALSPEADAARAAWLGVRDDALTHCASGRELVAQGYRDDVRIAAEVDASGVVPLLHDGRFGPAPRLPR